ncbi:MAG: Nif3-like dinuclear metal center hexameric protein [Bacteroidetes bacterium]|jgi:dinuclear metal center YbgI/SA1388 family protein|nr:Nif3-like dinuclear metal center hexameric protein [Bacteroidota bacterium]
MLPLKDIIQELERLAPLRLQESYDNSGLITGDPSMQIQAALICLDSTESVIDEAIRRKCNLVIAHHPIVFSGLKKITGSTYIERVIIKAIQNNIAIYAIHTNLDNVAQGVNAKICEQLGIQKTRILAPMGNQLKKLVTFAPLASARAIKNAIFNAGAGQIGNYSECSFSVSGDGSFKGNAASTPYVGQKGERHLEKEERIEVIFPSWKEMEIISALKGAHPYEEVAYDIYSLTNLHAHIGAGMVGELEKPMQTGAFLDLIKDRMNAKVIRHTAIIKKEIKTVAVCGGSGSFLLNEAKKAKADLFLSADFKYHQFFDAEDKIIIADIGHFETEQFTINLIGDYLREKFTTFAVLFTETNTNPIYYH